MAKDIMKPEEAARYLRISKPTLYKLIRNGEIPAKKIGNQWRVSKTVLDEIVKGGGQDEAR